LAIDGRKNRSTRRAAGLSIIGETVLLSDSIGPAVVGRIAVLHGLQEG
jgi:hypothetical protein